MFFAEKGNGAYLNNSRIRVSRKKKVNDALLVTGGPNQNSKIKNKIFKEYIKVSEKVTNVRRFGSAALDVAYVACGRFDGYFHNKINLWDIAAGALMVEEAGGTVNNLNKFNTNNIEAMVMHNNKKKIVYILRPVPKFYKEHMKKFNFYPI